MNPQSTNLPDQTKMTDRTTTPRGYFCSAEATANAFKGVEDKAKSRGDLAWERNTAKKDLREANAEKNALSAQLAKELAEAPITLRQLIIATGGHVATMDAYWRWYETHPQTMMVMSRLITGELTHKGKATVRRGKESVEIDAHLTPDGTYYKPWLDGHCPAPYQMMVPINRKNFTLRTDGEFVPILGPRPETR